jgi:hypothetical protein
MEDAHLKENTEITYYLTWLIFLIPDLQQGHLLCCIYIREWTRRTNGKE